MTAYSEETSERLDLSDSIAGLSALYTSDVNMLALSETLNSLEIPVSFSDTVVVSETVVFEPTALLAETLVFSDTPASALVVTSALSNTVILSETIGVGFASSSTDTLIASEVLATSAMVKASEQLILSDSAISSLTISGVSSDTLRARDEIGYGFIQSSADTLAVADSIAGAAAIASPGLADTVVVSEILAGPVAIYAALPTDTLAGSDTLVGTLALVGVLSDTVLFGDTLADTAYQTLIVVNAETGAVSTYTMTPTVTGLAEYRGTLYLAGPQGLYAMDADEDEEGEVIWTMRTGFSNLGSNFLKHVRDVNVQVRTEGELSVQAITDRSGRKQEYHYLLEATMRDAYRDGVVKLGRGLQSVYWAFGLQGQGPTEIDQLQVAVEPLSRRR